MSLQVTRRFFWLFLLAVQGVLCSLAQAAPQLDLRQQDRTRMNLDIRNSWQTTIASTQGAQPPRLLDAQALWMLPDSQFQPGSAAPVTVKKGERLIGRLSVLVGQSPHGLLLELPMPRLDLAHLSYRYNLEPWTQVSAGDQTPMVKWPFANRMPAFVIPPKSGELQLVLDIPVAGLFPSPVILWGDPAFREEHTIRNLEAGAVLALAFISLLLCSGAAVIFRRFAFVAVGLYSISIFLVTAGQGGILGIYIGTTTTWFNDYVKYITAAVFGAMVPWTISLVVAQKHFSRFTARVATFWLLGSLVAMLVMLPTIDRTTQWALLSPFLIASLLFGLGIALASVVRGQSHGMLSLAAVLLLCTGIFAPIAAYWGYLDGTFSFSITAVSFWLSTTFLLLALLLQYRHGNRVIERAVRSPGRDALTGLFNREVFERKLARVVREANARDTHALFLLVAVTDPDSLEERFGGEGFESGMVQIAAALSSSISVADTVARISTNSFGVLVDMPMQAKLGNALAQKLVTRILAMASHSAPMAQAARVALAWVPLHGNTLGTLEAAARQVLERMDPGKRVGWADSTHAHNERAQLNPDVANNADGAAKVRPKAEQLHSLINHIENDMRQENFSTATKSSRRVNEKLNKKPP